MAKNKIDEIIEDEFEDTSVEDAKSAAQKAAEQKALKILSDAGSATSKREAEKSYIVSKKKHMLNKCKKDEKVTFVPSSLYAEFFGKTWTFMYNTIPVTVVFDDTPQEFPKFVYDMIIDKITKTTKVNTYKSVNEKLDL